MTHFTFYFTINLTFVYR